MRFEVGEMARLVVSVGECSSRHLGALVEVRLVGPFPAFHVFPDGTYADEPCDYTVASPECSNADRECGDMVACDFQLQKLNPPEEPVEMIRHEEVEA